MDKSTVSTQSPPEFPQNLEKLKTFFEKHLQTNFFLTTFLLCVVISVPLIVFVCCCVYCARLRRKKPTAKQLTLSTQDSAVKQVKNKPESEPSAVVPTVAVVSSPTTATDTKPVTISPPLNSIDVSKNTPGVTVAMNEDKAAATHAANPSPAVPSPVPVPAVKKVSETKGKTDSKSRKRKGLLVPGKRASNSVMRAARKYNELSRDLKAILSGHRSRASIELIAQAKDTIGLEESIRDKIRETPQRGESAGKVSVRKSIKSKLSATKVVQQVNSQAVTPEQEVTAATPMTVVEEEPAISAPVQETVVTVEPVYPKKLNLPKSQVKLSKAFSQEIRPTSQLEHNPASQPSGEQIMEPVIIYKQSVPFPKTTRQDSDEEEEVHDEDYEHIAK